MEDGQKCDKQRSVRRKQLIVGAHRKKIMRGERERGGFSRVAIESRVVVDVYCILLRIMHCIPDDHHTTTPFVPE